MVRALQTSEVASRAGVNVQTLRFYERKGLIKQPPRRASGYRQYPADSVQLIRFIKCAQSIGFSLKEIDELLRLKARRAGSDQVLKVAQAKIASIDEKIEHLRSMRRMLTGLVERCPDDAKRPCPVLESLGERAGGARS